MFAELQLLRSPKVSTLLTETTELFLSTATLATIVMQARRDPTLKLARLDNTTLLVMQAVLA